MKRTELEKFIRDTYKTGDFQDYCHNGLQVEGKDDIRSIALGVSFNRLFMEKAIESGADAMIVHHGFFGKDFFRLTGPRKENIALCLKHNISLFGIHLPMDAHPEIGHNALLAEMIGADILAPLEVGFLVENSQKLTLTEIIDRFADSLQIHTPLHMAGQTLIPHVRRGISYLDHGPDIPKTLGIISGGSGSSFETALEAGADTFICGDIREQIPAIAYETRSNYIDLGHYYSEKPGVRKLSEILEKTYRVKCFFIDIENSI